MEYVCSYSILMPHIGTLLQPTVWPVVACRNAAALMVDGSQDLYPPPVAQPALCWEQNGDPLIAGLREAETESGTDSERETITGLTDL